MKYLFLLILVGGAVAMFRHSWRSEEGSSRFYLVILGATLCCGLGAFASAGWWIRSAEQGSEFGGALPAILCILLGLTTLILVLILEVWDLWDP